jgi:transposase
MMGDRQFEQESLFYGFSVERHVPADHLLRSIDRFVDLSAIRAHLQPFYSHTGRPSIDPELLIRMLIIGYTHGIRSERRLCEEVHLNLAYRWFCGLGLDGDVPDHSTFSKNRHGRFRESDLLRKLFEDVLARCIEEGLVGGEGFAVDASLIKADANRQKGDPGTEGLPPELTSRAVDEYLAVLDDAAFGAATDVVPKFISPSDPAARWTGAHRGPAFFAYCTNYLIDLDHAIIVDVEASAPIRQAEVGASQTMLTRTADRFGLYPNRLAADTAYGSAENLAWLVHEQGVEPHIPVFDKSERNDGTFSKSDFVFDHDSDNYTCPGGKLLQQYHRDYAVPRDGAIDKDGFIRYRATKQDCDACGLKAKCCPNTPARKVTRSIHEGARDLARDIAKTDAYVISRRERKKVEMLFAHLKRILKLDRLRLRGPNGAKDEFLLAATAQNLRKMAKLIPMPAPAMAG